MHRIITIIIVLITAIFFTACSSDDEQISRPVIAYSNLTIESTFFEEGNSIKPTVKWNGNEGVFSLATSIEGLSIDGNTGVLSWTKVLPQGIHIIEVVATNSAGQMSINLTLSNKLQGVFLHRFENSCFFELEFNKDGTLNIRLIGGEDIVANGSWGIDGNEIIGNYTFLENNQESSVRAVLIHATTEVRLDGNWYNGSDAILGQEGGSISLNQGQLPTGDGIIIQLADNRYKVLFYTACGSACCYNTIQDAKNTYPNITLTFVP